MVRQYVEVPQDTLDAWRRNRTARPKQVSEVLRLAFLIGPESAREMREYVRQLFKWRDWVAHPTAECQSPQIYPELRVATEWRLVAFRAENAKNAAAIALSMITQLLARPRPIHTELVKHCEDALRFVEPLVAAWELGYGPLYERVDQTVESEESN